MNDKRAGKRVKILFYLLTIYILIQFFWWAYLLVKLNLELYQPTDPQTGILKVWMIVGEGVVFFIFLLAGFYLSQRTIKKEIDLVRQQHNFLLSITHELKTPLAAIKLSMDTLDKHEKLNAAERQTLQTHVKDNTERLSTLIDNVLLATRIESGKDLQVYSPVDFSNLTRSIVLRMEKNHNHAIIKKDIDEDIIGIGDANNFESIVTNLVDNAIKYAGDTPISVSLLRKNKNLVLKVSDNGPGIPPEFKSRIFEKFYRTENEETRSQKGTGLGLYIVKNLVKHSKGEIYIRDNHPSGSIFIVELPLK